MVSLDLYDAFTWSGIDVDEAWAKAVLSRAHGLRPHPSDDCAIRWLEHLDASMRNLTSKAKKHLNWVERSNCSFTPWKPGVPYMNQVPKVNQIVARHWTRLPLVRRPLLMSLARS